MSVPRETVNDDTVTIQSWHAAHGAPVKARQHVVSIETSKAVLEVEADAEGFLDIIHAAGAEVPIGELIGRVLASAPMQNPRGNAGGQRQLKIFNSRRSARASRILFSPGGRPTVAEGDGLPSPPVCA